MVGRAAVAQLVERELPKLEVAGSKPVRRFSEGHTGYGEAMGLIGGMTRRVARRSRWLAERLWLIAVAEVAWTSWGHWRRLGPPRGGRPVHPPRKSKGRPSRNLPERESREAEELLDKLGHIELAGSVARTMLPFRPLSRSAEWYLQRRHRKGQRRRADARPEGDGAAYARTDPRVPVGER